MNIIVATIVALIVGYVIGFLHKKLEQLALKYYIIAYLRYAEFNEEVNKITKELKERFK
jgi:tetrahydromethanopterin S-methyltransferase subunit C